MKKILLLITLFFTVHSLKADVIISQYYEGASNDKWIEITNVGTSSASLSGLYLALFSNAKADNPTGQTPTSNIALSGTLASGASILFQNSSAALPSYASGTNTGACNFNGDDLLIISTTNTSTAWANRVDVIGNGTTWGSNKSFYRTLGTLSANTTYTTSEWIEVSNATVNTAVAGTTERLGEHEANIPLPIALTSFDATVLETEKSIQLNWQTASEENNEYFSIERSKDGIDFIQVGKVDGVGTTSEVQNYNFTDRDIESGLHYYRLKQVDFDGAFEYSEVITATLRGEDNPITISPNPSNDVISIQPQSAFDKSMDFDIINMQGQVVVSNVLAKGQSSVEVNISNFPVGIYYLRLFLTNEVVLEKIIKQ